MDISGYVRQNLLKTFSTGRGKIFAGFIRGSLFLNKKRGGDCQIHLIYHLRPQRRHSLPAVPPNLDDDGPHSHDEEHDKQDAQSEFHAWTLPARHRPGNPDFACNARYSWENPTAALRFRHSRPVLPWLPRSYPGFLNIRMAKSHTVKFPPDLYEVMQLRAAACGYQSVSAYLKSLVRYDALVQGDHPITLPVVSRAGRIRRASTHAHAGRNRRARSVAGADRGTRWRCPDGHGRGIGGHDQTVNRIRLRILDRGRALR